jgi:multidrug efflux pump subunit AcrA (membrane-fusion protein)
MRYPDGRTTVWTVEGSGDEATVEERQVELGIAFDGFVHVLDGIEAGERVVTRGNEALEPGQAVRLAGGGS